MARSSRSPGSARSGVEDGSKLDTEERLRHNQRARDNQRTSRARRKALLNDLQRRLDEYERRGVQATLEMQQAARRVAWENARLRALLLEKGVSEMEIEGWLRQGAEGGDGSFTPRRPAMASGGVQRARNSSSVPGTAMSNKQSTAPLSTSRSTPLLKPPPAGRHALPNSSQRPRSVAQSKASASAASQHSISATGPSPAERVTSCCTSATETSCEVAAAILANMQGHGDTSRARAALGCDGPDECTVKNTRVLELLDEAG